MSAEHGSAVATALASGARGAGYHYENTPIQIYRKFHLEKNLKNFR